ncbi:hypothetical protein GGR51DRAFT_565285 [Nemania sp. FL0031]|nr:hypothetical protein GGR51DRAFT_565285 [Nemania sp. FL0031]
MAETNNPMTAGAPTTSENDPTVSKTTLPIAGLLVDVYGLAELPPTATAVSCLWLHHPRLRTKDDMAPVAHEMVSAFNASPTSTRGFIVVAFDQRNHGSRLVDKTANEAWRQGNATHAQDMFGTVSGTVMDTIHLLDVLEGYLFGAGGGPGVSPRGESRHIDSNLVLGVSLGGHSAWQLLFAEPRVTAGVIVIGCPDYMSECLLPSRSNAKGVMNTEWFRGVFTDNDSLPLDMIQDRARLSKLQTYTVDEGVSFMGSKDFPKALIGACKKHDPKAILFGTGEVSTQPSTTEQDRLRPILDLRIRGKRFQVLSGGADKLVPYRAGRQFLEFFKNATDGWYKDGNVYFENHIYPDIQ